MLWLVTVVAILLGYLSSVDLRWLDESAATPTTSSVVYFYDLVGGVLMNDWYHSAFEEKAMDAMIAQCDIQPGQRVVEIGPGSGFLAEKLLTKVKNDMLMKHDVKSDSFSYIGVDMSQTMHNKCALRLFPFIEEGLVQLHVVDDTFDFIINRLGDDTVDRFVFTYVLDLLPSDTISGFASIITEKLKKNQESKVCVVNLTYGFTPFSRLVTNVWQFLYKVLGGGFVGGCRPISALDYFNKSYQLEYFEKTVSTGLPSEVAIFTTTGP